MLDWLTSDWIKSLLTPALISAAVSAVFGLIFKRIIQHRYDVKLEAARAEHSKALETLRAELSAKSEQLAALRGGALNTLASRYVAVDKRRFEAIEQIWAAALHLDQFRLAARFAENLNMYDAIDEAAKHTPEGKATREFADQLWKTASLDNLKPMERRPELERPYLSPLAWALYSAYSNILSLIPAQLAAMRTGVGTKLLADPKPVFDLIRKTGLPNIDTFIDQHGVGGLPFLLNELKEALLKELMNNLTNPEAGKENLERAKLLVDEIEKFSTTIERD